MRVHAQGTSSLALSLMDVVAAERQRRGPPPRSPRSAADQGPLPGDGGPGCNCRRRSQRSERCTPSSGRRAFSTPWNVGGVPQARLVNDPQFGDAHEAFAIEKSRWPRCGGGRRVIPSPEPGTADPHAGSSQPLDPWRCRSHSAGDHQPAGQRDQVHPQGKSTAVWQCGASQPPEAPRRRRDRATGGPAASGGYRQDPRSCFPVHPGPTTPARTPRLGIVAGHNQSSSGGRVHAYSDGLGGRRFLRSCRSSRHPIARHRGEGSRSERRRRRPGRSVPPP